MTRAFYLIVSSLVITLLAASCGKDPDMLGKQEDAFDAFFKSRKLDSLIKGGVYFHCGNAEREGRDDMPELVNGDSVEFFYEMHLFNSSSSFQATGVIATNKELYASVLPVEEGPFRAKLGSTPMISGLKRGLPGCRQGDSVLLFITSDLAYGSKNIGVVPKNTPIVYILNIDKVKKPTY